MGRLDIIVVYSSYTLVCGSYKLGLTCMSSYWPYKYIYTCQKSSWEQFKKIPEL